MTEGESNFQDRNSDIDANLKHKFVRGVLFFYIINLAGLWIGVIGIKTLGNLEGIALMLAALTLLQVVAGYLVLKLSDRVVEGENS